MKITMTLLMLFSLGTMISQNEINWDGKYKLQLSDFQSQATQISNVNLYSLNSAVGFDFSFYMSNFEFMFTKNFNSKVNNVFKREASAIVAPNDAIAQKVVDFAQYQFDLSELYARKFRKRLFEEKSTFSNVNFFKPIYEAIQKEFTIRQTNAGKETDLGQKSDRLQVLQEQVIQEIAELDVFCKECKAPKKK